MPAKHIVKCKYCGESFDTNEIPFIKLKNRYAHQDCGTVVNQEAIQKAKDKDELAAYILSTFGEEEYKNPKVWVQFEKYYSQGLTPKGLYNTLVYMIDVKKRKALKEGNIYGLIPYYYKEAQDFENKLLIVQELNKNKVIAEKENKNKCFYSTEEVEIVSPQKKRKKRKLFSFLDDEVK